MTRDLVHWVRCGLILYQCAVVTPDCDTVLNHILAEGFKTKKNGLYLPSSGTIITFVFA